MPLNLEWQCLKAIANTTKCSRCCAGVRTITSSARALSADDRHASNSTIDRLQDTQALSEASAGLPDPQTAWTRGQERRLREARRHPIGSRRRRAALTTTSQIPFEQLPYECFQEARKILLADRQEKIQQIQVQRARLDRVSAVPIAEEDNALREKAEQEQRRRIKSMSIRLENLKILADVNDPLVKKKFEDGQGDMNKPIYRHLARRKFLSYRHKILEQRITQMHVVPDVLPSMSVSADIALSFGRKTIQPGAIVPSGLSSRSPRLALQVFDQGQRLVSVAVVDPDVPDLESNGFISRCHFLACNIPISPTDGQIRLDEIATRDQLALDWLPPYAQKGSPYHRLCVVVLEQPDRDNNGLIEMEKVTQKLNGDRTGFSLRSFTSRHTLKPLTAFLFRNVWDEDTDRIMRKLNVPEAGEELKRKRVEPLLVPRKPKYFLRYR